MYEGINERAVLEGKFIVEYNATVRSTAKNFNLGKSTVHKDVTKKLKEIDYSLFKKVRKVLDKNLKERHIRGGLATRKKYLLKKEKMLK